MLQYQVMARFFHPNSQRDHSAVSHSSYDSSTMTLVTTRNRQADSLLLPSNLRLHPMLATTITETEKNQMRERMGKLHLQAAPATSLFRRISRWVSSFFYTAPLPPLSAEEWQRLRKIPTIKWVSDTEILDRVIGSDEPHAQSTQEERAIYYVLLNRLQVALSDIDNQAQQILRRSAESLGKHTMNAILNRGKPGAGTRLSELYAIRAVNQRRVDMAKTEAIDRLISQFQQAIDQLHLPVEIIVS